MSKVNMIRILLIDFLEIRNFILLKYLFNLIFQRKGLSYILRANRIKSSIIFFGKKIIFFRVF
jgi:hypothetical protein